MARIGSGLQLEQKQTQKLSPVQMQMVEILQMDSLELQQKISEEMLENPVLEEMWDMPEDAEANSEPLESDEFYFRDDEFMGSDFDNYDDSDKVPSGAAEYEKFSHKETTFHEHLLDQLMGTTCSKDVREAAEVIIYSLDDDGYLDTDEDEIAKIYGFNADCIIEALAIVRRMDPAGIGYRSLQECLKSQLDKNHPLYAHTCAAVDSSLADVARGDIRSIAKAGNIKTSEAQEICGIIRKLEPRPGTRYSDGSVIQYVNPDIRVDIIAGEPNISICSAHPRLGINEYYQNMYKSSEDDELTMYLKDRIGRADLLIRSIEMRNATIINVTRTILKHQRHFLEPGNKVLLPLTMQEVADELGIHISTVSRAVNGKYVMIGGGTYSLRYFFSNEINGCTPEEIKSEMKQLIRQENPKHPLSDQKIADMLKSKGYDISRRTVAKYRDSAGILPAGMRKTKK